MKATIYPAKYCLIAAVQMLKVQLYQMRIVKIGRKVVTGARGISAHTAYSIPNLGRQAVDMFRIPRIIVSNLTTASERG
ncbi:hypothetical protein [Bradyrhizobium erythrophlei]|uniref:hypothetical protein n=1 Tax=Bradyrhizobium erythrophlei TaxID=1437360 RepID=UPI0012AB4707|nr:hypothetical protein [Bradyrhizobium erythrophlei]